MPISDNILACFQDDAILIWDFITFDCIKRIAPNTLKAYDLNSFAFTREVWFQFCV
jgi:hypothetical protein